jgi:hypothetical protein
MDMNHNSALLDKWVGTTVYLRQLGGEQIDDADFASLATNPRALTSVPLADTSSVVIFEGYDQFGITIRVRGEEGRQSFVPWGGVLHIEGRPNNPAG